MENELKVYKIDAEELKKYKYAIIKTQKGNMIAELFGEETPQTVMNFATLTNKKFYDGLNFHRVIENFVIQGGCPLGTGTGGPGYRIKCECAGQKSRHERGSLSMAHAGHNTGGSQFFICHSSQPHLDGIHTVFGRLIDEDSKKVLDSIHQGDIIKTIEIKENL